MLETKHPPQLTCLKQIRILKYLSYAAGNFMWANVRPDSRM